jgi:hypothetical protein
MSYKTFAVQPGKEFTYNFPAGFQARWVRVVADKTTGRLPGLNTDNRKYQYFFTEYSFLMALSKTSQ